jgi:lipopolysaccharide transport system permease protein
MLSYRDIRVRYAQTWLGILWALINPIISMLLLYVVFSVVVKADTQGIPALVFIMAGLYSWNYFARVTGEAGTSLLGAQSIVKKVYFPRLIIPLSKAVSALVDLGVVLVILVFLLILYQIPLSWKALMIIPFTFLTVLTGFACGIWVAALNVRYRDFNHIVPVVLRIGMFLSPIAYNATVVPDKYKWLFLLNPLTGIMEGSRWALFNTPLDPVSIVSSIAITLLLLISGIWYFLHMDQYIADII